MNIKLPDPTQFNFKECVIGGDECVLVTPKSMGVDWNDDNKYFRSSVWRRSDMFPVSLGWRKFMNWGEKPEFEPWDSTNTNVISTIKKDGTSLIVSRYKGELIVRTRGTVDASLLTNGHEIEFLKKKYPKAFNNMWLDLEKYSLLFEWTTPSNRIVLNESPEPVLWLIGIVEHATYTYFSQFELDQQSFYLGVSRPDSIEGKIDDIINFTQTNTSIEGVVVCSGDDQVLKKIKTPRYIFLHRAFTGIKTADQLFEYFVEQGCAERPEFENWLSSTFDWELVVSLKDILDELYLKWKRVNTRLNWMYTYINSPDLQQLDRKAQAGKILELFPQHSGMAFGLLSNKNISPQKLWDTLQ